MKSKLVCTACPKGCEIKIVEQGLGGYNIEGNCCETGRKYAEQEIINPARIFTTTVKINNALIKRLPVRSKEAVPKNQMIELMKTVKTIETEAPIKQGEVIIENILDTGIDIIASKSIAKKC